MCVFDMQGMEIFISLGRKFKVKKLAFIPHPKGIHLKQLE